MCLCILLSTMMSNDFCRHSTVPRSPNSTACITVTLMLAASCDVTHNIDAGPPNIDTELHFPYHTGSGRLFTPFWVMPLITDLVVFLLMILCTRLYANENGRTLLLFQLFVRDGALYFLCIFSANLLNVVLFLVHHSSVATEDLKAIGARFSQIITSVMILRLVLNLRTLHPDMHGNSAPSVRNQGCNRIDASGDTSQKKSFFDLIITTLTGIIITPWG
ncbi:hypothetical protein JB92DRAFT_3182853 [Gautieria morchelliformis]|nr:hypothetical protein JB92DRAFT_3182853 [Gautieria morchelliformis]